MPSPIVGCPLLGTYSYPTNGVRLHAVSSAGVNTYSYDNNGNMTGGAGRTFVYDNENRPTSITSAGVTTTFVYDGDGGRVKKIRNGVTTVYVSRLYECVGTSCTKYIFAGRKRIAMKQVSSGVVDYFHADHLGSTSVMTTASGVQAQAVTYYPYGGTRTHTGAINVPYKFTGKELDETTLYFYGARYYDPVLNTSRRDQF